MAVPFRKVSKTRRNMRRTHYKITANGLVECTNCGAKIRPHRACPKCGFYKGADTSKINLAKIVEDEMTIIIYSKEEILEKYLGRKITLIPCAGGERISSEREQWNDGTNTLCIAPGVVVVYDRNNMTNNILREHGIKVLEMPSAELSRGRGGPRCMSMPLIREEI